MNCGYQRDEAKAAAWTRSTARRSGAKLTQQTNVTRKWRPKERFHEYVVKSSLLLNLDFLKAGDEGPSKLYLGRATRNAGLPVLSLVTQNALKISISHTATPSIDIPTTTVTTTFDVSTGERHFEILRNKKKGQTRNKKSWHPSGCDRQD